MPPLPGHELGDPPPPVPRELPRGFALRTLLTGNFAVLIGGVLGAFTSLITYACVKQRVWAAVAFMGLFALGGWSVFWKGLRGALSTLRAFRRGVAVEGVVYECRTDRAMTVNGEHPLKLTWHFTVDGRTYEGSLTSLDSTLGRRAAGQPLWILYVAKDPTQNTLYPPVR